MLNSNTKISVIKGKTKIDDTIFFDNKMTMAQNKLPKKNPYIAKIVVIVLVLLLGGIAIAINFLLADSYANVCCETPTPAIGLS